MKEFDEWWEIRNRDRHDYSLPESIDSCDKKLAEKAYQAGMLAAADIAELAKEFILPADDLADLIAKQIREYADDD